MYSSIPPPNSALDVDVWSAPRPGRFTPRKDAVPIVQWAEWDPGPVWTGGENLAPHRDSIPDRPVRSESLYRLSYSGPCNTTVYNIIIIWGNRCIPKRRYAAHDCNSVF